MPKNRRFLRYVSILCLNICFLSSSACRSEVAPLPADDFNAKILEAMERTNVPGLSLSLLAGGRVEPARMFGVKNRTAPDPVGETTVFEACSLSKPVLAYAALILVGDGRLDLDKPLLSQASEDALAKNFFRGKIEDDRIRLITPRMVLSHRSGFPNWRRVKLALIADPGATFGYSGEGFVLLQKVIEQITGRPLNDFIKERVFTPLGMTSSSYVWIPEYEAQSAAPHSLFGTPGRKAKPTVANGAASLHTTSGDYARFLAALLQGVGLKEDLHRQMLSEQTVLSPGIGWGLGLGLEKTGGREYLWHWGDNGDFKCFFLADVKAKSGFVYFANGSSGLSLAPELTRRILGNSHPLFSTEIMQEYDPLDSPIFDIIKATQAGRIEAGIDLARKTAAENPGKVKEAGLNSFAYALMNGGRLGDAIKVFELNVGLFPGSGNAYDSLAEALEKRGDVEGAIRNYELSLKYDPRNENAVRRLQALRKRE